MNGLPQFVSRLCLLGVLAAALGLAACGRKGNLDLPPAASAVPGEPAPAPAPQQAQTPQGDPLAPVGPKRRIPLDVLLN